MKKQYTWTFSKRMWSIVRPMLKVLQWGTDDSITFSGLACYSVAECYDRVALTIDLEVCEYIRLNEAFKAIGDELDALIEA